MLAPLEPFSSFRETLGHFFFGWPMCLVCFQELTTFGLCAHCWGRIVWLHDPLCHSCGVPVIFHPIPGESHVLCPPCQDFPSPFTFCRALMSYDAASKPLILRFKHGRDVTLTQFFSHLFMTLGKPILEKITLLTPVPLHWRRLGQRSFNQASLMAQQLSRLTGIPYAPLLKRSRATASQGHLSRQKRYGNVLNAFTLSSHNRSLAQEHILLIDDVYTTGATLKACASVLKQTGAGAVSALTIARIVRFSTHA